MLHKRVELGNQRIHADCSAIQGLSSDTPLQFSRWRLRHKEKKRARVEQRGGVSFIWIFYEESKANRLIKTVYIFVAYIQLKDGIY